MISPEEEEYILTRAYVPEHIVSLMALISKGDPFLIEDHLGFGRGDVGSNATCVLGSDQSSEIMRKWEEGIIGSSVNPVRKDRALTTPFL